MQLPVSSVRRRFSSLDHHKSASSPLPSPVGGLDNQVYTLPDHEDKVFEDGQQEDFPEMVGDLDPPPPPTPGTAPYANHQQQSKSGWSQRKLRLRDITLIVIAVVLIIGLAVGTALAIILVNTDSDSSSSSSSSSSSRNVDTSEEEIIVQGQVHLAEPWEDSLQAMQEPFSEDLNSMLHNEPAGEAFITSSVQDISANNSFVTFQLRFKKDELEEILADQTLDTQEEAGQRSGLTETAGGSSSLAEYIQEILNTQVARQGENLRLPYVAESFKIYDSTTTTAAPDTTTTTTTTTSTTAKPAEVTTKEATTTTKAGSQEITTGSKETSSTGKPEGGTTTAATIPPAQCAVMTFQPCRDVLESTSFYLPNWLNQTSAEEAESSYTQLLSRRPGEAVESCERVSSLYLCALLFPPCAEPVTEPFYPCDSLCQAVQDECGTIEDWPSDCHNFPSINCTSSSSPPPTETTSAPTTTTSEPIENYQCTELNFQTCNDYGFSYSLLPNKLFNCEDNQCLIEIFESITQSSLEADCYDAIHFFCSYVFHMCTNDDSGMLLEGPIMPCQETCTVAFDSCQSHITYAVDCAALALSTETSCVTPIQECFPQENSFCESLGFNNSLGYSYLFYESGTSVQTNFETLAMPVIDSGCYPYADFVLCGLAFPYCPLVDDRDLLPCAYFCHEMVKNCPDGVPIDCTVFDDQTVCLSPDMQIVDMTDATQTTTTANPNEITTTSYYAVCEKLDMPLCETFGFTEVAFPNAYGDYTQEEALKKYYQFEPHVAAGCSQDIAFFACVLLFPPCEDGQYLPPPCMSICEAVNADCTELSTIQCNVVSADGEYETCLKPPEREDCAEDEFTCNNTHKCVPKNVVCDQKNDCYDWSDERGCECDPQLQRQCAMGMCIPSYQHCDREVNCPDNSDEASCGNYTCTMGQYACVNSTMCIQPEWLCDAMDDCPHGDDEKYCTGADCQADVEWECWNKEQCVRFNETCDGTSDCSDYSDEYKCVIVKSETFAPLEVVYDHVVYANVCMEGFTADHALSACLKSGYPSVDRYEGKVNTPDTSPHHVQMDVNGESISSLGNVRPLGVDEICPENLIVHIQCSERECGVRKGVAADLLIGGTQSQPGSWPWVVSFQHVGKHKCGGAIIHPYFVLTAAHCIRNIIGDTYLDVVGGTVNFNEAITPIPAHVQIREVRRFISYPGYTGDDGKDIALIELKQPFIYSDTVQPLCLPRDDEVFSRTSECFLAGWGYTEPDGQESDVMMESKMSLVDTDLCNSSAMWNGMMAAGEKCAGYYNALITACSGDSGSPVSCRNDDGSYKATGVAIYVRNGCQVPQYPTVYSEVLHYMDWINETMQMVFVCADGIALFDEAMLCDSVYDCEDGSDEIQKCDITVNCTFDTKFVCGYKSTWLMAYGADATIKNRFPLFDHTIGRYPGYYQQGYQRGMDLISPRVDLTTGHCIRFHYHMRGYVDLGLSVYIYNLTKEEWEEVLIEGDNEEFPDRWLMATFDLLPGNYDLDIRTHDDYRISVDDIYFLEGTCAELECFSHEFMCTTYGRRNCLPIEVQCNAVVDCDDAEDEKDCATTSDYFCSFENGNLCGLQQDSYDSTFTEWMMANSSHTPGNLQDHTSGLDNGTMLMIETTRLLAGHHVNAFIEVYLRTYEHCLTFYYFSSSEFSFQINLSVDNIDQTLFTFTNRKTSGWVHAQATLPAVVSDRRANLTITIMGGDLTSFSEDEAVILLDDITIIQGQCPDYMCPADMLQCEEEMFCVAQDQQCDMVVDCEKATDEISCVCEEGEFDCPSGPCIREDRTCDLYPDCPDSSDEGAVCDPLRTVSCDFEHIFQCGYTCNTSESEFNWASYQGKISDTGPSSDHTYYYDPNVKGYYMIGESTQLSGSITALTSAPFTSAGNGLLFYYYAYQPLYQQFDTGRLTVIVNDMDTGEETELWHATPDLQETWKESCITLPAGELTLSFVLWKGDTVYASIALDDVLHLNTSCDMYLVGGRISGGATTTAELESACPDGERPCRSGMCLPNDNFCDETYDCVDGSDEDGCPT